MFQSLGYGGYSNITPRTYDPFDTPLQFSPVEHQIPHIEAITDQLIDKRFGVIDTSTMGTGKTYTTTAISHKLHLPMLVVCPAKLVRMWEKMRAKGANVIGAYSYERMRLGVKSTGGFPYLIKQDKNYAITKAWYDLLQLGVLLVIDESHRAKNSKSIQTEAISTLIRSICKGGKSRFMLLSATPYDTEKFISEAFRTLGYTHAKILSDLDKVTKIRDNTGILDIIKHSYHMDPETTQVVVSFYPPIGDRTRSGDAKAIAVKLFLQVFKKNIIFSMESPPLDKDVGTLFANMTELEYKRYRIAVANLADVVIFNDETGTTEANNDKGMLAALSLAVRDIEYTKVGIYAREAARILNANPNAKVIIGLQFKGTIPMILDRLSMLTNVQPLVYTGDIKNANEADAIIDAFQAHDNRYRLFIATIASGAEGISLHDTNGNFPRTLILSPGYSILKLHQASGRIVRVGSLSKGTVRLFFGKYCTDTDADVKEQRIIDALTRKAGVLSSLLDQAVKDGVKFPGEYEPIMSTPEEIRPEHEYFMRDVGINTLDPDVLNKIDNKELIFITTPQDGKPLLYPMGITFQRPVFNLPTPTAEDDEEFTYEITNEQE